jgi:hypothetical protein
MKIGFNILCFFFFFNLVGAQENMSTIQGEVSFVSSRNVYVKFASTNGIKISDTLFVRKTDLLIPVLIVDNKSSNSTVCHPLIAEKIAKGTEIMAKIPHKNPEVEILTTDEQDIIEEEPEISTLPIVRTVDEDLSEPDVRIKQKVKGKISGSSYSSLSDYENKHRMRYAYSFEADQIQQSKWSVENYFTFRHTLNEWDAVKENLTQALKVYSLNVKYDLTTTSSLLLGRKINPRISNMGAIDGLQYEKEFGNITLGVLAGSRPDYTDYSFNIDLLQIGAYLSINSLKPDNYQQTTIGFVEQRNKNRTDRRFAYFQHSSQPLSNVNVFGSVELDLFESINNEAKNRLRLTNFYLSLRYRIVKNFRISVSYDNRKNIIYYESYKSFIDRLIEDETRQGLRFGLNFRPTKKLTWGVTTSFRFQSNDDNISKNYNSYVSFSKVPILKLRASLRVNFLETNYLKSKNYGIRMSKNLIPRKLNGDFYFRFVNYQYKNADTEIRQKLAGLSFSYRFRPKLSLYLYYEATLSDQSQNLNRINTKIIQRF